jgi:hypothetical protein
MKSTSTQDVGTSVFGQKHRTKTTVEIGLIARRFVRTESQKGNDG